MERVVRHGTALLSQLQGAPQKPQRIGRLAHARHLQHQFSGPIHRLEPLVVGVVLLVGGVVVLPGGASRAGSVR